MDVSNREKRVRKTKGRLGMVEVEVDGSLINWITRQKMGLM